MANASKMALLIELYHILQRAVVNPKPVDLYKIPFTVPRSGEFLMADNHAQKPYLIEVCLCESSWDV